MEHRHDERVERILADPAQAEAGERHADLRDREQPLGVGQQIQSCLCAGVAFLGELLEPGFAHRNQSYFRGGKERIHREDQQQQKNAKSVVLVHQAMQIRTRTRISFSNISIGRCGSGGWVSQEAAVSAGSKEDRASREAVSRRSDGCGGATRRTHRAGLCPRAP